MASASPNAVRRIEVHAPNYPGWVSVAGGRVVRTSAELSHLLGWSEQDVLSYLRTRKWTDATPAAPR
jgi:hypothetical protein